MRILVLGLDSPLGYSLRSFAAPLMRHEIIGVEMDATRWRRERQVKKLIRRQPIDLILDARLVTQIDGVDPVGHPDPGPCMVGSLTGAVASQTVTEARDGGLKPVGHRLLSAMA